MGGFACLLTRQFHLYSLPLRAQPPLMPYRRRITIRWQSGGGLCAFPVVSPWARRACGPCVARFEIAVQRQLAGYGPAGSATTPE